MIADEAQTCPSCGQQSPAVAKWCEECGHDLAAEPKPECVTCGEAAVEDDGYCHSCGHRQPGPRDHVEVVDGSVAAVSDRGQRHHHNEDAVAVAVAGDGAVVLVVCDGVSSTPGSAEISQVAASVTADTLLEWLDKPERPPSGVAADDEALLAALDTARSEVDRASQQTQVDDLNPPSSTLVTAVARMIAGDGDSDNGERSVAVSVMWLGDSRVYWLDGDRARLLTVDHEIDGALTRWLGADAADHRPEIIHETFTADDDADLIVCSDGMWRYFHPELGQPAPDLVRRLKADGLAGLALVRAMVDFANECGGHDNISVAHWAPGSPDSTDGSTVDAEKPDPPDEGADQVADQTTDPASEQAEDDPPEEPTI